MIVWNIESYLGNRTCYSTGAVFDTLTDKYDIPTEDAIDAESWCELAYVGEVYQGEDFRITVEEE